MGNYEQNRANKKHEYQKSRIIGATLIAISVFMLLFTTTNLLMFIKSFFLGTFGIICYPVFAYMFLFGLAFLSGRRFVMSKKYLLYILTAFMCIMAIFHIMFTQRLDNTSFGNYLSDVYYAMYTPGGVLLGIFTYPVTSLLNHVAGYVLYAIILSVVIALIIDYLYAFKQFNKLAEFKSSPLEEQTQPIQETTSSVEIFQPIIEDNPQQDELFEEEPEQEVEPEIVELSAREIARRRLNLAQVKVPEENKQRTSLYETKKEQEDNFLGRGINNSSKPPKIVPVEQKKDDGKDSLREFLYKTYGRPTNNVNTAKEQKEIINESNYAKAFDPQPIFGNRLGIEPIIQQKKTEDSSSPIVEKEPEKPMIEEIKPLKTFEPVVSKVEDEQNEKEFVVFDEQLDKTPKGISPLNPKALQIEDSSLEDSFIIKEEPKVETPQYVELDPAAAIAQENMVEDSLQKTVELNAPKFDNGIDIRYVQQFIKGTEKQQQKAVRRYSKPSNYVRPPIDLLTVKSVDPSEHSQEENDRAVALENVLAQFKIDAKVVAIRRGASVTRFELQMPLGTPVNKIAQYTNDIAMVLRSKGQVRIELPIRGKNAVGVEIPNDEIDTVGLKDIIESPNFINSTSPLTFGLGKDVDGKVFTCNIQKMPHLLVAGTTGSGKSVCLNAMITSILYKSSPEDVKLILIDPKKVEFSSFNYLPHMLVPTAITEPKKALNAFDWLIQEMENRFLIFQEDSVKNIEEYNDQDKVYNGEVSKLPYILLIVDEFADLQNSVPKKTDLEDRIKKLAAKSRAAGIHIVIATQRPSVDVITGVIKNNLPSKIAFAVGSSQDSRTILGTGGAEKLLGKGDMLYAPNNAEPTRIQCALITTQEVNDICEFVRTNNSADFDESIEDSLNMDNESSGDFEGGGQQSSSFDPLMKDAVRFFIETQKASSSSLQRKFAIGFNRAARITDEMYKARFIGPSEGSKPGSVYITKEQFEEIFGETF